MVKKYQYIKKEVKVGYPNGFSRYDPRLGKNVHVSPYERNQKIKVATSDLIVKHAIAEKDWGHLSYEYPNLLGVTDNEIDEFIKNTDEDKEITKEYLKHIKCYDKDDIRHYSKKAFIKFEKTVVEKYGMLKIAQKDGKDPYSKEKTIFVTSPRGGFEIISDFAYTNGLSKTNLPYDLEKYSTFSGDTTMRAVSLPYGYSISDVNDIVFVDDIYMSGEQCEKAFHELKFAINKMNLKAEEIPRLHYVAITGSKFDYHQDVVDKWNSFSVGDEVDFRRSGKHFNEVSAVIYPFSIPDGGRHKIARKIYGNKKRFKHRKWI